ncbi:hypothetical protein ACJIZ3_021156 [Penstemon smallii]|uniref:Uncharacterized protein n=1 Tax=Penstemon smallii TaxID=265156 RepID=A0ABD3SLG8_9LAMI
MPKERRARSLSFDRSRRSPFTCSSSYSRQSLPKDPLEDDENIKEWEDARCPVCMEHPHNAILLLCSSHEKGCRPFMCDTSYRHSNCFDQFRKSFEEASAVVHIPDDVPNSTSPLPSPSPISEAVFSDMEGERSPERSISMHEVPCEDLVKSKIICPLCRGPVNGWTVVKTARRLMNSKSRSCASEICEFSGTYTDLRKHARLVHPLVRPTEADPERQRNWRRLERQRDLGDLLSTLQSSIGEERTAEESTTLSIDDGGWLTVFFLVRFIRPGNTSTRSSTSRTRAQVAVRRRSSRRLWGETLDGVPETPQEDEILSSQSVQRQYVRRRFRDPVNDAPQEDEIPSSESVQRQYVRRRFRDPDNDNNESSDGGQGLPRHSVRTHDDNESSDGGQGLPRHYVRTRSDNESSDGGQGLPRQYVRTRFHNQENQ